MKLWSKGKNSEASVSYLSLSDLLRNKHASGRPKDLVDFDELGGNKSNLKAISIYK